MSKIIGNYLTQANRDFPVDCETFDYLQTLTTIAEIIGNVAGDKVVLYGCKANEDKTQRAEGYVFLRTKRHPEGEVLKWEGGSVAAGMYVKMEDVRVTANNSEYPKAYTKYSLAAGYGDEHYNWEDFSEIKTITELLAENKSLKGDIAKLSPAPLGIIQMWAGVKVPEGYLLCNGQEIRQSDYPDLYAAIGTAFNSAPNANGAKPTTQSGYFRVPDLRGRFVVGQHDSDNDYKNLGNAAGKKTVALTEAELPTHKHSFKDYYYAEGGNIGGDVINTNSNIGSAKTDWDNDKLLFYKHNTDNTGGGEAHENRPPYYTLAYIIRAK